MSFFLASVWISALTAALLSSRGDALDKAPNFLIFVIDDSEDTTYIDDLVSNAPDGNLYDTTVELLPMPLPNVQRIINEGISFPRSYCGGPKCAPARYSILTGRQPTRSIFSIERTLSSSTGEDGVRVTVTTSKMTEEDQVHNVPTTMRNAGYATGMVGKWHLITNKDNGYNLGCKDLLESPDATLYQQCAAVAKESGWDFIDGLYHENVAGATLWGHNPEWMVDQAQTFMQQAMDSSKPFYLHFAHTLTHTPLAEQSMLVNTVAETPGGILKGDDVPVPSEIGMRDRQEIWDHSRSLPGIVGKDKKSKAPGYDWMDDALGALIRFLERAGELDNTFLVVMNDHGMGSKATLYELGTRIWQFIRYPPLFGKERVVMSQDWVVSATDLAAVMFGLADVTPEYELTDSIDWLPDVVKYLEGDRKSENNTCCQQRISDMCNSHAIVAKDYKYLFRSTNEVDSPDRIGNSYQQWEDEEQLYYLVDDEAEQNNLMPLPNDASDELKEVLYYMQQTMIEYRNDVCPVEQCKVPTLIDFTPMQGTVGVTGQVGGRVHRYHRGRGRHQGQHGRRFRRRGPKGARDEKAEL